MSQSFLQNENQRKMVTCVSWVRVTLIASQTQGLLIQVQSTFVPRYRKVLWSRIRILVDLCFDKMANLFERLLVIVGHG